MESYFKIPKSKRKTFIGLKYNPYQDQAPKILFKFHFSNSDIINNICKKEGITIIRDEWLVEVLRQIPSGREIPEELFIIIAKIYKILYNNGYIRKKEDH